MEEDEPGDQEHPPTTSQHEQQQSPPRVIGIPQQRQVVEQVPPPQAIATGPQPNLAYRSQGSYQQPPYSAGQQTYPASQEMPPNAAPAATAAILPQQDQYAQQQKQPQQQAQYPVQGAGAAGQFPASYPQQPQQQQQQQHYQQGAPIYHPQQPVALQQQQPQYVQPQQQQHLGVQAMVTEHHPAPPPIHHPQPFVQPTVGRLPSDRPLVKLSVSLIDTYKQINKVYYEEREARRAARAAQKAQSKGQGANNNGWDDENYDYIITNGEKFYGRYIIKERIGKGSFGQVVRAVDTQTDKDVAIKIIKSKKPFLMQAKTEIDLLTHLGSQDPDDQNNIVRLEKHFMYRNHQCLVFEMLSLNLYELLKNTQFGGVSLNLIRKFAKQVLKALAFLAKSEVDIIHCDLKPENILLRHPKRSGIKVIDFGSSCRSNKRMYSYIQSRFYRSPEVMLGLPYSVAIDMWSLGCILAEMHTGEPLFSGSDQFDQMQKIVKFLGMVPPEMLEKAGDQQRTNFFEKAKTASGSDEWVIKQTNTTTSSSSKSSSEVKQEIVPSSDPIASLSEVLCSESTKKKRYPASETGNSERNYELFVDLIYRMLAYLPEERIKPEDALNHPFIRSGDGSQRASPHASSSSRGRSPAADSASGEAGVVHGELSGEGSREPSQQEPSG